MVTVLGHRGYLGAVVERRWQRRDGDYVVCTFDDLPLIRRLAASGPGVIVPSTDAIAEDTPYAERKRAIEAIPGIVVIRAGIVDIHRQPADGYFNWYCNPLTPLEWADLAWEKRDQPGVHVAGRELLNRYDVQRNVRHAFSTDVSVITSGTSAPAPSYRVQPADRERPRLWDALVEFREWLK